MAEPHVIEPGMLSRSEAALRQSFLAEVDSIPGGKRIKRCIQCGTCSGMCPVSYAMDIPPRGMIALFRAGDIESILRSRSIWLCASCYACTIVCPSGIKVTDILYALKRLAMARGIFPKRFPIHVLSQTFVEMVNRFGRNNERLLLTKFFLRTNPWAMIKRVPLAFRLWMRGRMPLGISRVRDLKGFQAIMQRARDIQEARVPHGEYHFDKLHVGYGALEEKQPAAGGGA